jgi:hypothetical protein
MTTSVAVDHDEAVSLTAVHKLPSIAAVIPIIHQPT